MAAVGISQGVKVNNIDDKRALLDKEKSTIRKYHYDKVQNEEAQTEKPDPTFWEWLFSKPLSKFPFIVFVVGLLGVPALGIYYIMDPDTAFIILGSYIGLNIFGFKHFYTLIGLRQQVNHFGSLNKNFSDQHREIKIHVDSLTSANLSLKESQNRIRRANAKNQENLSQFRQLQENMKDMQIQSIDQLGSIQQKADKIGDKWQSNLVEKERDMLHTVFDRFEEASGKSGMTIAEFEKFSLQLPESYRKRFERLGAFKKISSDGIYLTFEDFDVALDLFAEMEAANCDIDFTIEKTDDPSLSNKKTGNSLTVPGFDDNKQNDDDISMLKRWRTSRKRLERDAVKKKKFKVKIHSRHLRTATAKRFTKDLGFDLINDNDDDSTSSTSDKDDNDKNNQKQRPKKASKSPLSNIIGNDDDDSSGSSSDQFWSQGDKYKLTRSGTTILESQKLLSDKNKKNK